MSFSLGDLAALRNVRIAGFVAILCRCHARPRVHGGFGGVRSAKAGTG
jgi:hypothetical protein